VQSGAIIFDKPSGWTSRRAVNEVARLFSVAGNKRVKAGHTGTLDPLATGMLPILLGETTRFAELGLHASKTYRVTLDLHVQTETLDKEGEQRQYFDIGHIMYEDIHGVVASMLYEQEQIPPVYSAIRVDGQRAHALARQGEVPVMQPRRVYIESIAIESIAMPCVTLCVTCSKGTYIRALARDIAGKLGVGGCVQSLRRLSTAGWSEACMVSMTQLEEQKEGCLLQTEQWLHNFSRCELPDEQAKRFVQGQRIPLPEFSMGAIEDEIKVRVCIGSLLLGVANVRPGMHSPVLHPERILPSAQQALL